MEPPSTAEGTTQVDDDDDSAIANPQAPPGWRPDEGTALDPSFVRPLPTTRSPTPLCACATDKRSVLSQVISLVRSLLPVPGGGDEASAAAQEEAGCMLWDLTAVPVHAAFLVEHALLPEVGSAAASGGSCEQYCT